MLNSRYTIIRFDNFLKVVKSFNKNGISNGVNDFFHCVLKQVKSERNNYSQSRCFENERLRGLTS